MTLARPQTQRSLYLCALATLVSSKAHAELLEAVFSQVFGGLADPADQRGDPNPGALSGRAQRTPEDLLAQAARAARTHASGARPGPPQAGPGRDGPGGDGGARRPDGREAEHRYLGSGAERLAAQDFAELSEAELLQLAALMRRISLAVPLRGSRRQRRRTGGPHTDMRSTLRQARRTGGDVFRLISRAPARGLAGWSSCATSPGPWSRTPAP